jgi:hypothetical protein
MGRHPNPRLVKIHRSYTVEEVARNLRKHKNTVRAWMKRPRFFPGKVILVEQKQIIEMSAAEMPEQMPSDDGFAKLQAEMDKGKDERPSVESILRPLQERARTVRAAQAEAVAGERPRPFPKPPQR